VAGIDIMTVVFGFAGLIIFSVGLTWVMWQVMDRY
jgi:heme/copper-type cytochrome/quinol oxidase subunit 4